MRHEHKEVIASSMTAELLVPVAKTCLKEIKRIREKKDADYLNKFMSEYNSKWYNKLFRQSFKNVEEVKEYIKKDESTFPDWFWKYPSIAYYETEKHAQDIVDYFEQSQQNNPTYVIPIDIYNDIKSFCE